MRAFLFYVYRYVIDDTRYGRNDGRSDNSNGSSDGGTVESKPTGSTQQEENVAETEDAGSYGLNESISTPGEILNEDLDDVLKDGISKGVDLNEKETDLLQMSALHADVDAVLQDIASFTDEESVRL